MPLYSDHYYYGSGQPPAYYLPSSSYTPTTSRISSPYSFSYMSPISAMLSAGIGTNPLPRGLRSYSPMLSSISEAGSPLMSRRDIGNHRSSPRRLGGKNYYRQRPVVIDTDSLDLSKRKKEDNEEVESTPGMISRAKTIVRMHTRKLKENPELKKKKTQAEILMEKYFIKEKPIQEEEIPRRKRIWEEREEELNNTLIRGGTIKRLNTVNKRPSNSVPVEEVDIPEKLDEIIPVRKMSIDSELFKEEEALLDCMIQEELGLGNLKEMKGGTQEDEMDPDRSNTIKRKSKIKKDQMSYGRRKSSLDIVLDESGALVGKRKSHVRKKKTSKPLPLDEVNMSEGNSGSDSSSKDIKDDTKMNKRRSTKKKKPPKFKIDSLHVEEKSSPKVLRKFQYEVIVEDGKNSDKSSGKLKSVTHINIENIPKDGQHKLLKKESSVKSDVFIKTNIDEKSDVAGIVLPSNICDSKCDTLTNSLISKNDTLTNKNSCMEEVSNFDCKNEIDHIEKKTEKLFNNVAVKGLLDRSPNNEPDSNYRLELEHVNKHKTEATEIESLESQIDQKDSQKKLKDVKLLSNQDIKIRALPDKNKQHKSPLLPVKTAGNKTKQESFNASFNQICGKHDLPSVSTDNFATNIKNPVLKDCNPAFTLEKSRSEDEKKTIQTTGKLEEQVTTMKQKSLTPDLSRKITSNLTHKSEPTTPIMHKKQVLPLPKSNLNKNQTDANQLLTKSVLKTKPNETQVGSSSDTIKLVSTNLEKQSKTNEIQPLDVFFGDKEIKPKPSLVKTEAEINAKKEPKELTADVANTDTKKVDTQKDRKTEEKQIDEIRKNKNPPIKMASNVINKDLFISNKKEEASPFHLKKLQDGIFTRKASKDKIVQLNIENAEARLGKGEENNRTGLLTKDNQIAVKFTDNLNGLQKILPTEKAPSNPQLKEEVIKKELDCNSNQISEISFVNKLVAMNKGGIPPQKKVNVMDDNVVIAIKIEQNEEEEKEVKSKNLKYVIDKNKKVENINGKDNTNKILSKHALESAKPDLTSGVPLKNHQLKEDIIKKPGGNIFKSTDIPAEKSLKTKNDKDCDETQAAAVREKRHMNKDKIIPSKGDEKPSQGRDMFSKEIPTILKIGKTNPPKAEVVKNVKKEDNNKVENIKVIDNAEISSTPLVSEKVEETNKTIGDTVKSCLDDKIEFHYNLGDKKTMVNEVKKSESKLTDNLLKQPKETLRGDKIKQSETKPTNIPSKQTNLAATISKTQEKMNDGAKVKGNELGASFSDRLDQKPKANSKETELSNKDQVQKKVNDSKDVVKKVTLDKEKTIQVSNEKKKRIKSESDTLDDECSGISGKAEISSKETDNKMNEKSQSLKETTTENSSKKKKRSKDKGSSKKNTKSPRKTKESPKTDKIKDKLKNTVLLESHMKTTSSTTETVMTTTVNTTTTIKSEETEHSSKELSKRSTRLLHFINKCMRLSEDDGTIVIDYSDEEDSSSSSSEYSSDSEYTSDSEEDTLTEDSSDGSSESRDHGSPTRRHSNAALSLDDESSRTGSGGTGAGRVTPPATTIPKFRKYTMDDFQFLKVLGKGSFGKVLLAELRGTQYYYAVKCLKKDVVLEDDDVECTLIERKVLALGTNHPYLCHLFCTFQTESHLFFVMEYLNGGDLMFHIQQQGRFDEGRARFYAAEIISGLKFLHKKGIVYRDLKLDNILLDFDGHVRIADFGMCKLQIYLDRTADTFCGTPDYMAPEIIKGLKYNQCVDWWSFGILMYEMLVGQSPFSGCDEDDLFWCICNRQPHYPRFITLEAKRILMQLLEKEASKRLGSSENGAIEVMAHPFFNGLDWDRLERRELMPPFKPNVKHPLDVHYFDKHFTAERACLTPIDPSILQSMDQTQFQGFSYTNPNVTD